MSETNETETCDYCGAELNKENLPPDGRRMMCPGCGREGCLSCMPGGKSCTCPECEEGDCEEDA